MQDKKFLPHNESYWDIVWRQFRKRKDAIVSLVIIFLFFFIAIYAPFLANRSPIILYTTYGEHYEYKLASWKKTHEDFVSNFIIKKELLEKQQVDQKKFNDLKQKIFLLNQENDKLNNEYENITNQIDTLEKQIKKYQNELSHLFPNKSLFDKFLKQINEKESPLNKENNSSLKNQIETPQSPHISLLGKKLKEINSEKTSLEQQRKKNGAKQVDLKRKMFKTHTAQQKINIKLIQYKYQLNFEKNSNLIIENLEQMKFPVNNEVKGKINLAIEKYQQLFQKYQIHKAQVVPNGFTSDFKKLKETLLTQLDYSLIQNKLEQKVTFPIFASLTILDIIFMVGFPIVFLLPYILKRIRRLTSDTMRQKQILLIVILVALLIPIIIQVNYKTNHQVPLDYKKLIIENFLSQNQNSPNTKNKNEFAFFPIVPYGFNENYSEEKYQKPALLKYFIPGNYGRHLLGTDSNGRDVLSRMIWGARVSLSVGFVAVSIYVLIGIIVGAIAGYFGGWIDIAISRIIEIVICFPSFFLILTIIAFLGPSIFKIMIVIGLTSWPGIARLTRGEFLKLRNQDFVIAAKSLGIDHFIIIFRHILPNALTPVLVSAAFGIASAMLTEAGLSFLGFGVREPFPSWGQMISVGQSDVLNYWWLSLIPGIAIFISVTIYNLVGDALREAIDPRLKE